MNNREDTVFKMGEARTIDSSLLVFLICKLKISYYFRSGMSKIPKQVYVIVAIMLKFMCNI